MSSAPPDETGPASSCEAGLRRGLGENGPRAMQLEWCRLVNRLQIKPLDDIEGYNARMQSQ